MAAVAKPSNTMHIIILTLLGVTLAGVLFLVYVAMGDDGRYERMVSMMNDQKTMIGRVENNTANDLEGTTATQPTTSAVSDVVIYEDPEQGFRFATAPGCEGVFEVRKVDESTGGRYTVVDQYAVFAPKAQDWPKDAAIRGFITMTPAEYNRIGQLVEQERDSDNVLDISWIVGSPHFYVKSGNYLIAGPVNDSPSPRDLAAKQGGVCSYVAQQIPTIYNQ